MTVEVDISMDELKVLLKRFVECKVTADAVGCLDTNDSNTADETAGVINIGDVFHVNDIPNIGNTVHSRIPPTRSSSIGVFSVTSARGNPSIPNLLLCASHDARSQRCHVNNCMHVLENLPD